MGKAVLLLIVLVCGFIALYESGLMFLNAKTAASYIGSSGGNAARFTSCSGSIKRVVRFREDGTCHFVLDAELSRGEMSVELLDGAKQRVMLLDRSCPRAAVTVRKSKKYVLVLRFRSATGRFSLTRE